MVAVPAVVALLALNVPRASELFVVVPVLVNPLILVTSLAFHSYFVATPLTGTVTVELLQTVRFGSVVVTVGVGLTFTLIVLEEDDRQEPDTVFAWT
jgi:hypothetical protein